MWNDNESRFRDILWGFDPLNLSNIREEIDEEYDDLGQRFFDDIAGGMPVNDFVAKWPQLVALEFHGLRLKSADPMIRTMTHELRIVHAEILALVERRPIL